MATVISSNATRTVDRSKNRRSKYNSATLPCFLQNIHRPHRACHCHSVVCSSAEPPVYNPLPLTHCPHYALPTSNPLSLAPTAPLLIILLIPSYLPRHHVATTIIGLSVVVRGARRWRDGWRQKSVEKHLTCKSTLIAMARGFAFALVAAAIAALAATTSGVAAAAGEEAAEEVEEEVVGPEAHGAGEARSAPPSDALFFENFEAGMVRAAHIHPPVIA